MNIEWNCGDGDTVVLVSGDRLGEVPDSHVDLLTEEVRQAFRNPVAYFADIAKRCSFADMQRYLRLLIDDSDWELRLHTNGHHEPGIAAFAFATDRVEEVELSPGQVSVPVALPPGTAEFYSLVDWMR